MIINIRGTSGSGKSTLVRAILKDHYLRTATYREEGRKQPLGYRYTRRPEAQPGPTLGIPGHYETDCGGCDTISSYDKLFSLLREAASQGDVLYEGLLISGDVERTAQLWGRVKGDLVVIWLDVPIEECLDSVNARRRAKCERRGVEPKPDVNPRNTIAKHRGMNLACGRLTERGVKVLRGGRVESYNNIRGLLGL